jgi:hypothetical protein
MKVEREVHEVEVSAGKLYVMVLSAERRTYGGGWRGETSTEEIKGRVWLATDPEFKGDVELGYVKVRGRKYTIEHPIQRLPEGQARINHETGITWRWNSESSYMGGFRNDKHQQVSFQSKAWDSLGAIEREALDKFAEEHPEWEQESSRLLFERERDHFIDKARKLTVEADQADIQAALWQKRIDDMAS